MRLLGGLCLRVGRRDAGVHVYPLTSCCLRRAYATKPALGPKWANRVLKTFPKLAGQGKKQEEKAVKKAAPAATRPKSQQLPVFGGGKKIGSVEALLAALRSPPSKAKAKVASVEDSFVESASEVPFMKPPASSHIASLSDWEEDNVGWQNPTPTVRSPLWPPSRFYTRPTRAPVPDNDHTTSLFHNIDYIPSDFPLTHSTIRRLTSEALVGPFLDRSKSAQFWATFELAATSYGKHLPHIHNFYKTHHKPWLLSDVDPDHTLALFDFPPPATPRDSKPSTEQEFFPSLTIRYSRLPSRTISHIISRFAQASDQYGAFETHMDEFTRSRWLESVFLQPVMALMRGGMKSLPGTAQVTSRSSNPGLGRIETTFTVGDVGVMSLLEEYRFPPPVPPEEYDYEHEEEAPESPSTVPNNPPPMINQDTHLPHLCQSLASAAMLDHFNTHASSTLTPIITLFAAPDNVLWILLYDPTTRSANVSGPVAMDFSPSPSSTSTHSPSEDPSEPPLPSMEPEDPWVQYKPFDKNLTRRIITFSELLYDLCLSALTNGIEANFRRWKARQGLPDELDHHPPENPDSTNENAPGDSFDEEGGVGVDISKVLKSISPYASGDKRRERFEGGRGDWMAARERVRAAVWTARRARWTDEVARSSGDALGQEKAERLAKAAGLMVQEGVWALPKGRRGVR